MCLEGIRNVVYHLDSLPGTQKLWGQILVFLNFFYIINEKKTTWLADFWASDPLHLKSVIAPSSPNE